MEARDFDIRYPVEILPPSLAQWRPGNCGVAGVWRLQAAEPGPALGIVSLMHGNEFGGAIALDRLLADGLRPARGSLCIIFANLDAFDRFDRDHPRRSRCVERDLNRLWDAALVADDRGVEGRRARELLPLLDGLDHVLDLHSMSHPCAPLLLPGLAGAALGVAEAMAWPGTIIRDGGHEEGPRLIDHPRFAGDGRTAILAECGQHWAADTPRVALETALRWLGHFGAVAPDFRRRYVRDRALPAPRLIEVVARHTVTGDGPFRFAAGFTGLEVLKKGDPIGQDGGAPVAAPFDGCILVMPAHGATRGQTAVRLGREVPA